MASAPSTPPSSYKDLYLELRSQYEEVMKFRFESSQQLTEHENVVDELQEEINNMLDLMMELNPSLKINQIQYVIFSCILKSG
ncbi:hypothetical protein BKA69DRAFT_291711 [Paraphysoderma sedebokerense]|nr:hypothetical protein BKA69DRAFT_291711 [Paraphysoderma sedebokerense]